MLATTMKQYMVPIFHLLIMCLRSFVFDHTVTQLEEMLEEGAEQSRVILQIHSVLMALWTTQWKPKGTTIADPTEHCLALLTLKDDGAFKEAKVVTPIIAKFEYCMRLTFLREIHSRAANSAEQDAFEACNQLQPFFVEKNYFTFSRLCFLQHKATAIAYNTQALPDIWWTNSVDWTSLSYKGNHIALDDVCQIFRDTEDLLINTWENKVLCRLDLSIVYATLVDDLTNKDVGYSFVLDSRNEAFRDRTRLVRAAARGEGNFKDFLMTRGGELTWNVAALRRWLLDYAELHKLLLLRAEMLGGAPARGTELTTMTYRNTQTRTRNLVCMGKHVTLLCQYSKTTALTGRDKLIPHGLDAVTSDILLQDLVLARPFAELAAKVCFGTGDKAHPYRDHLFVNFGRPFTSEDLSDTMAHHSLPRIHYRLTIHPWRHIQTAWKRKFKCAVEEVMEIDQADDIDALQAGHTRSTENRIYGISTTALAGAPEDVLPLFLHASTTWQERCKVVAGGRLLSYRRARWNLATSTKAASTASATMQTSATDVDIIVNQVVARLTPALTTIVENAIEKAMGKQVVVAQSIDVDRRQRTTSSIDQPGMIGFHDNPSFF